MEFNTVNNGQKAFGSFAINSSFNNTVGEKISANKIREYREFFEQESQHLQNTLGSKEHQSLMIAMYEGTENLIGKEVNDFDVVSYLESLKNTAQLLHNRGLTVSEFRNELLRTSQNSVFELLKST